MKTYEEAVKEMAKDLQSMEEAQDQETRTWYFNTLNGEAMMVAFLFGKEVKEVKKDVIAAA